MSWRERAPGPFSLWARFTPRNWPPVPALHVDPVHAAIFGAPASPRSAAGESMPVEPPVEPEVTYLPPVAPERAAERNEIAARIAAAGGHALVHLRAGEVEVESRSTAVVDLVGVLLAASAPEALAIPAGAWVVVPLIPGLFQCESERQRWLERLAELKANAVVGLPITLEPTERRRLAEIAGEARWEAIFHGETPDEHAFARAVTAVGLATLPPRPAVSAPPRAARNRDLSTVLAVAGELWLRLGRGEGEGGALLAAARRIADGALDFAALAREGNLPVVDWLSPLSRRLIEQHLRGATGELAALRSEWNRGTAS